MGILSRKKSKRTSNSRKRTSFMERISINDGSKSLIVSDPCEGFTDEVCKQYEKVLIKSADEVIQTKKIYDKLYNKVYKEVSNIFNSSELDNLFDSTMTEIERYIGEFVNVKEGEIPRLSGVLERTTNTRYPLSSDKLLPKIIKAGEAYREYFITKMARQEVLNTYEECCH